jgi:AAHS family 4-hydroxybenzoate transporter-like MFS transporter
MSRTGAVLGAGVGTSLASMGMTLQQVFLLMLAPITIGAVCMAIKGLTGRRNADVPDVQWMSAHLSTTGVNPTSDTTNGV